MQMVSPSEQWACQRKETEEYQMRCLASDFDYRFADGIVAVRSFGPLATARVIWDHGYGERALDRGPYAAVHAHVGRVLRNGPTFGPVHTVDCKALQFTRFESDESVRATRPHGEVRVKPFLGQHILLFVPDGGVRLLYVSPNPDELKLAADVYGPEWTACSGPRLAVRFEGRDRPLHVSNNPSELAYHEIDKHTRFSLRPHRLPEGDAPAQAALYFFRGEEAHLLVVVPIDPTFEESMIWSDDDRVGSAREAGWNRGTEAAAPRPPTAPPSSPSASPPAAETAGAATMSPALRALVLRYLCDIAAKRGGGKEFRQQSERLLRAAERGQNLSGWGASLRGALECACDYPFSGAPRGFAYLIKALKDDGILARPWGRKCQLVFAELHHPDSPAIALLCAKYGVTPESVFAGAARPTSSPPPPGRTPPTTPPASAPTAAREHERTSPPSTGSWASPPAPAVETTPGSSPTAPDERAGESTPGGSPLVSGPHAPEPGHERPAAPPRPAPDLPGDRLVAPPRPVPNPASDRGAPPPRSPPPPPFKSATPEDPFAAVQRFLRTNPLSVSSSAVHVPLTASATPPAGPVAPVFGALPDEDFMRDEFLFLDRRILRSSRELRDEELQLEDGDGLPRGPPDEE